VDLTDDCHDVLGPLRGTLLSSTWQSYLKKIGTMQNQCSPYCMN